jgi:hypothetical protein
MGERSWGVGGVGAVRPDRLAGLDDTVPVLALTVLLRCQYFTVPYRTALL